MLSDSPTATAMLFDPTATNGAHLNLVRLPLTSTDLSPTLWNWSLSGWNATPPPQEVAALNELTGAIKTLRPNLEVVATPWSAPASMKAIITLSETLRGGALARDAVGSVASPGSYTKLLVGQAAYLLADGVPLTAMTLGNEPFHSADYTSMTMTDDQMISLAEQVSPRLRSRGVSLWAVDHNWSYRFDYDKVISGAPGAFSGSAFHCYGGGDPSQMSGVKAPPIMTECTGTTGDWSGTFVWDMSNLVVGAINAGSTGLMMWNLALNPPHQTVP